MSQHYSPHSLSSTQFVIVFFAALLLTFRAGFQNITIEADEAEEGDKINGMGTNGTEDDDSFRQHRSTNFKNIWDGLDDESYADHGSPEVKQNWDGTEDEMCDKQRKLPEDKTKWVGLDDENYRKTSTSPEFQNKWDGLDDESDAQHQAPEVKNKWDGLDDESDAQQGSPEVKSNWDGYDDENDGQQHGRPQIYASGTGEEFEMAFTPAGRNGRMLSYEDLY